METDLSKRAVSLSVGQKFLICLARIILSDCTLLILDEALSHVDKNSQKFIQDLNISDETVDVSVNTVEKEKDVTATIVSFQDGCGESHKLEC